MSFEIVPAALDKRMDSMVNWNVSTFYRGFVGSFYASHSVTVVIIEAVECDVTQSQSRALSHFVYYKRDIHAQRATTTTGLHVHAQL